MTYDIIVLGSGPAGLAAAVGALGRGKTVLVIGNSWKDSPLAKAEKVDNYLGLPGLTGLEMLQKFHDHAASMGAEFIEGKAISVMAYGGAMVAVGSEVYQGRALILATGVQHLSKFPGEEALVGRGVSYCATCDGMLYRNRPILVVGRSKEAPAEANYLHSIGCQVTYTGLKAPEGLDPAIPFLLANKVEIQGEQTVTGALLDGKPFPCHAVFVMRQAVASTDLLPQLKSERGRICIDPSGATNLEGVFAAGDCTGAPLQVAKAVGQGHVAALSCCEYLDKQ